MRLTGHEVVPPDSEDTLWQVYEESFERLRDTAAQRHVLLREEFDALLADKRVMKYVVTDDDHGDRACGLLTMTNELEAVPLVSPDYFRTRWPQRYADGQIWYVVFLAVHPDYQGTGAIGHLIGAVCATAEQTGGVVGADICAFNEETLRLPLAIGRLARTFTPGVRTRRLDAQTYWAYEFPTPA